VHTRHKQQEQLSCQIFGSGEPRQQRGTSAALPECCVVELKRVTISILTYLELVVFGLEAGGGIVHALHVDQTRKPSAWVV